MAGATLFSLGVKPFITMIIRIGTIVEIPVTKVLPVSVKSIYGVGRNGLIVERIVEKVHLRGTNVGRCGRSRPSERLCSSDLIGSQVTVAHYPPKFVNSLLHPERARSSAG